MNATTPRELRISVKGLEAGMFVSRLDRPWIETKFPLQGLMLADQSMIDDLRGVCSYVYIDTSAGRSPDPRWLEFDEPTKAKANGKEEFESLRRNDWTVQSDFEIELKQAESAHEDLQGSIEEVMTDLESGKHIDLRKLKDGVSAMVDSILRNPAAFTWLKEIKRRDNYAYQHAMGCAIWAGAFGRHLGLDKAELHELALGALLCDVGKTRLPIELLAKQGRLEPDEVELVHRHVEHSLEIVQSTPGVTQRMIDMVASHHERHDGSGYPQGLSGSDIPMYGRIIGLVDSYDAMTCVRPWAGSLSPHKAVSELYEQRGRQFQPELVEQFIQTCGIYPTGSLVELSSGEVGVVTAVHSLKRLRPRLMLLLDRNKRPLEQFRPLDLSQVDHDDNGEPLTVRSGLPVGAYGIDPKELFLD
ncbi:MAG TPA: HD-GYP domain-containing protein [Arenimonas sp.]|nr:HD-GYP domain-containing protein [Arenimonas sp.]